MRSAGRVYGFLAALMFAAALAACGGGGGDRTAYYADADLDGYGDAGVSELLDAPEEGWVLDSTDCDDGEAAVHPGAPEVCNDWLDDDCNGQVDCYDTVCGPHPICSACTDVDADGYFAVDYNCSGGNDCDDTDLSVNPGVDADGDAINACEDCDDLDPSRGTATMEVCNDFDDDCDGAVDEGFDIDRDGFTSCGGDCDDNSAAINPAAVEVCNGADDNCDSLIDPENSVGCTNYFNDGDRDGFGDAALSKCLCVAAGTYDTVLTGDCDDSDAGIRPGVVESCNGVDDDCDGLADPENSVGCTTYYYDGDRDGFGSGALSKCLCAPSGLYDTTVTGDCDDTDAGVRPSAVETCNGADDDCDGLTDEENSTGCAVFYRDGDNDGYGLTGTTRCLCAASPPFDVLVGGDCNDLNPGVNPGAVEVCNGVDDNCNASVDEGCPPGW